MSLDKDGKPGSATVNIVTTLVGAIAEGVRALGKWRWGNSLRAAVILPPKHPYIAKS